MAIHRHKVYTDSIFLRQNKVNVTTLLLAGKDRYKKITGLYII